MFPKKEPREKPQTPKLPPSKRTIDEPPSPFEKNRHLLPTTLPAPFTDPPRAILVSLSRDKEGVRVCV